MQGFNEWYEMYPRKVAKKVAQKAWARLTEPEKREAMEALPNHIKYWKLQGTDKEFIPHPATWLNQGRASDEIDLTPKEAKKPKKSANKGRPQDGAKEQGEREGSSFP